MGKMKIPLPFFTSSLFTSRRVKSQPRNLSILIYLVVSSYLEFQNTIWSALVLIYWACYIWYQPLVRFGFLVALKMSNHENGDKLWEMFCLDGHQNTIRAFYRCFIGYIVGKQKLECQQSACKCRFGGILSTYAFWIDASLTW